MKKDISYTFILLLFIFLSSCNETNTVIDETNDNDGQIVRDYEGNVYNTVKIGSQIWTVENLRVTKYNDGTPIYKVEDVSEWLNLNTGGYSFYKNSTETNFINSNGALYNWYAINTGNLAPKGWHVPTDEDWYILLNYLIDNGYNYDGSTTGNKIGKALAANTDWTKSMFAGNIGTNLSLNNSSGFSGLPSGYIDMGGYSDLEYCGYWWSSSITDETNTHILYLHTDNDYLAGIDFPIKDGIACSIRLIKD